MTEMVPIGSATDVKNVNSATAGFQDQLSKMLQGLQGAQDPLNAFMGALPGLFGAAIGGSNAYTDSVGAYRDAAVQRVRENALAPWQDAFYSSGARDSYAQALGEFETGLGKEVIGMQTNLANSMAGYGASLLGNQTNLLAQLMGVGSQLAAPEWWQPTYQERNTGFGNFMEMLGPLAGIASLFIPGAGAATAAGAGASLFSGLMRNAGQRSNSGIPTNGTRSFSLSDSFIPTWGVN